MDEHAGRDEGRVERFEGTGGSFRYRRFVPPGPAIGRIVVFHGLAEHGRRHAPFARVLARAGWDVAIHDHRGHGISSGHRGHVDDFAQYVEDARGFVEHLDRVHPLPGPRFLYAHSMGGLVAVLYLRAYPADFHGAVMTAPLIGIRKRIPTWKRLAAIVLEHVAPRLALPTGAVPEDLSRDPERNADYANDPEIVRRVSVGWLAAARRAIREIHADTRPLRLPMLVLHGTCDDVTCMDSSREFFAPPRAERAEFRLLEGMRHEPLNDIGRESVHADILDWLAARARSEAPLEARLALAVGASAPSHGSS